MGVEEAQGAPETEYAETQTSGGDEIKSLDDAVNAAMAQSSYPDDETPDSEAKAEAEAPEEGETVETDAAEPGSDQPDRDAGAEQEQKLEGEDPSISEPPQHWNKDWQEQYANLPDEAKRFARELDKTWARGFNQKIQEYQEAARYAQEVSGVIPDTVRQQLHASGQSEAGYIQNLAQWHAAYMNDPAGTIRAMAEQARLDPSQVFQQQQGQEPGVDDDDWEDPELKQLRSQLGETQQKLQWLEQNWTRMNQQQQQSYANQTITAFANARDEAGNAMHPYFDQVQHHMAALMQTHPQLRQMPPSAEKLQAAYRMAIEPFEDKLQAAERHQREAQERQQHSQKVKAATTPKPRPGSSAPADATPQTLDDVIAYAAKKVGL